MVEVIKFSLLVLRLRKTSWIVVVAVPEEGDREVSVGRDLQSEVRHGTDSHAGTVSQLCRLGYMFLYCQHHPGFQRELRNRNGSG